MHVRVGLRSFRVILIIFRLVPVIFRLFHTLLKIRAEGACHLHFGIDFRKFPRIRNLNAVGIVDRSIKVKPGVSVVRFLQLAVQSVHDRVERVNRRNDESVCIRGISLIGRKRKRLNLFCDAQRLPADSELFRHGFGNLRRVCGQCKPTDLSVAKRNRLSADTVVILDRKDNQLNRSFRHRSKCASDLIDRTLAVLKAEDI